MKLFNVPNTLTMIRILMIPLFVYVFFIPVQYNMIYAASIYVLAAITDILDGHIARKYNLITDFGKLFDPLADKLLQLVAVACLVWASVLPVWFFAFYILKELLQVFGGFILLKKGTVVSSDIFGKLASVLFYISTVVFILFGNMSYILKNTIMITVVAFSLLAAVNYIIKFGLKKDNPKLK
jgi:cardiolipin synthase